MKKSMLYVGLLSLLTTASFAEGTTTTNTTPETPAPATNAAPAAPASAPSTPSTSAPSAAPASNTPPATNTAPNKPADATPPKTDAAPVRPVDSTTNTTTAPQNLPNPTIDCQYKIPAEQTTVDPSIVNKWSKKATEQAFSFDFNKVDQQLTTLKNCFTDQGWQSFYDALQKSGNLTAIKSQKLMVSSTVQGDVNVSPIKDNQWKVSLPMQVVYQNDKEKLNQNLTVNLVVGRKITGELGIMQIVAMPKQTQPAAAPAAATPPTPEVKKPAEKPAP